MMLKKIKQKILYGVRAEEFFSQQTLCRQYEQQIANETQARSQAEQLCRQYEQQIANETQARSQAEQLCRQYEQQIANKTQARSQAEQLCRQYEQQIANETQARSQAEQLCRQYEQQIAELTTSDSAKDKLAQTYQSSIRYLLTHPQVSDAQRCLICGGVAKFQHSAKILNKYDIGYYYCSACGHMQTEKPYWLSESYAAPLQASDTGLVSRNLYVSKMILSLISSLFSADTKCLEYAGGYGLLTRLLRDSGLDCKWYDKYADGIFSRGFEDDGKTRYDLVFAVEALEHFEDPLFELETIFSKSNSLLFTQELLSDPPQDPAEWWYYCLEHGQHLNLYSEKCLAYIAAKFKNKFCFYRGFGLFTDKMIDEDLFKQAIDCYEENSAAFVKNLSPLTFADMLDVIERSKK
ncbi:MAG: methyltransferase domain-containing protein [Lentisphaeria bacterium]|nr:methyltransferase domain-containing protein [Lentisphaeria bacterium]